MPAENFPVPSPAPAWGRDLWLLALIFGALFAVELGTAPLANPDESRYAEVPREMVATGDWVTPRLDGVVYFEKPPLVYWIGAVFQEVLGANEWSMRAIPAVFALGGVLLTYAAGRRLNGRATGLLSAVVLGTSLMYWVHTRILLLDMAVSVLMSATLFCFILGVREQPGATRRWLFYGLYASAALATLAKGLIGFLLTGAVMFFWLLLFNQWRRLRPLYLPTGLLLFSVIAVPWHMLAALRNPEWAHFYFIHEHWERFTTTEHGRVLPWWIFFAVVPVGLFPWTGFLWFALRDRLKGGWAAARKEDADVWFLVFWAGFILLFFSKSQSKLLPYILPVFPPLAVLIGAWLAEVHATGTGWRLRWGLRVFGFMAGILGVALLVATFRPGIIKEDAMRLAVRDNAVLGAVALFAGGVASAWLARTRGTRAALLGVLVAIGGLYIALAKAQDEIARSTTRELAQYVAARLGTDDRVYQYHNLFQDFLFYGKREAGIVSTKSEAGEWDNTGELELQIDPAARASGRFIDDDEFGRQWTGPGRIWVVARKDDESVTKLLARQDFQYHLLAESRWHLLFSNQP